MNNAIKKRFIARVRDTLPRWCALNTGSCYLRREKSKRVQQANGVPYVFVMRPYKREFLDTERASKKLLRGTRCVVKQAKDVGFVGAGFCQICRECHYAHFGISELTRLNPNVMLETGLMLALSKPVILTLDTAKTPISKIPFDVKPLLLVIYQNKVELEKELKSKIEFVMTELRGQGLL